MDLNYEKKFKYTILKTKIEINLILYWIKRWPIKASMLAFSDKDGSPAISSTTADTPLPSCICIDTFVPSSHSFPSFEVLLSRPYELMILRIRVVDSPASTEFRHNLSIMTAPDFFVGALAIPSSSSLI